MKHVADHNVERAGVGRDGDPQAVVQAYLEAFHVVGPQEGQDLGVGVLPEPDPAVAAAARVLVEPWREVPAAVLDVLDRRVVVDSEEGVALPVSDEAAEGVLIREPESFRQQVQYLARQLANRSYVVSHDRTARTDKINSLNSIQVRSNLTLIALRQNKSNLFPHRSPMPYISTRLCFFNRIAAKIYSAKSDVGGGERKVAHHFTEDASSQVLVISCFWPWKDLPLNAQNLAPKGEWTLGRLQEQKSPPFSPIWHEIYRFLVWLCTMYLKVFLVCIMFYTNAVL